MSPFLRAAINAAEGAGRIIRSAYTSKHKPFHYKDDRTLVTKTDLAAEIYILRKLQNRFPSHSFLSEEAGEVRREALYRWLIDPLDGTTNFIRGIPHVNELIAT